MYTVLVLFAINTKGNHGRSHGSQCRKLTVNAEPDQIGLNSKFMRDFIIIYMYVGFQKFHRNS